MHHLLGYVELVFLSGECDWSGIVRNRHPVCLRLTPCPLTPDLNSLNSDSQCSHLSSSATLSNEQLLSVALSAWAQLASTRAYDEIFMPCISFRQSSIHTDAYNYTAEACHRQHRSTKREVIVGSAWDLQSFQCRLGVTEGWGALNTYTCCMMPLIRTGFSNASKKH